ncbi:hypothetical protein BTA31_07185 [Bacillus haynesii]|uniref:Uncharacterized protein n=1 Tax=Bacillus haynesii TaxID=1925021 RepID=A0ABX3I8N2_9BACI|nr:hypothetical protein BTA31_07185 [Bacillus haynesii]
MKGKTGKPFSQSVKMMTKAGMLETYGEMFQLSEQGFLISGPLSFGHRRKDSGRVSAKTLSNPVK